MVEELQPTFSHGATPCAEVRRGVMGGLLRERAIVMRYPRRAHILNAERAGLVEHRRQTVAQTLIADMHGCRAQSRAIELRSELRRRQAVSAGQLHFRKAERAHARQRSGNILADRVAHSVELHAKGTLEVSAQEEISAGERHTCR